MNKNDFIEMLAEQLSVLYDKMSREIYKSSNKAGITAEEAVKLGEWMSFEDWGLSSDIYSGVCKKYKNYSQEIKKAYAIGAVFFAGKVAGIRQERAARKQNAELNVVSIEKESA